MKGKGGSDGKPGIEGGVLGNLPVDERLSVGNEVQRFQRQI